MAGLAGQTEIASRIVLNHHGQRNPPVHVLLDGLDDRCPAGQRLEPGQKSTCRGKERISYSNVAACKSCLQKAQCTTAGYRKISRLVNEAVVERQASRAAAHPEIIQARKSIVEHVFGTLRNWNHDRFLMRGLEKVRAEFTLSALVYNLRRVLTLISLERWLQQLQGSVKGTQAAAL